MYLAFRELPEDEAPPKRIWTDNERLSDWFEDVRRRRARDHEGGDWNRQIDDPVQNQAALELVPNG